MIKKIICTTVTAFIGLALQAQKITTIAGNGSIVATGDGGAATAAELKNPFGVAVDASGNVYISDYANNRIRKVNTAGIISTVAGNGVAYFSGDGGQATAAQINNPLGIAFDGTGNLYMADVNNMCIRKVTTAGIISTIAGNTIQGYSGDGAAATAAELNLPYGVAVDASGYVCIADKWNNRIRKVRGSNIGTFAGNGTGGFSGDGGQASVAQLNYPSGVAIDAAGNTYIADYLNQRIRKVTTAGIISTFAGNGTQGFSGDGGQATAAELSDPIGLAFDASGNVYIADYANNRIRQVTTAGIISTFAGNVTAGYTGDGGQATAAELNSPTGAAFDAAGNMYIADYGNLRIRKITTAGVISTFAGNGATGGALYGDGGQATAAELNYPTGAAMDAAGNMYIADQTNNRVRKVNTAGIISTVAGNGTAGFSGDGGQATAAEINQLNGVALDGAGNLYIADINNNRIRKVTTAGIISTFAGTGTGGALSGDGGQATAAQISNPVNVAIDGAGNLYIADLSHYCIRKVIVSTGIISTVAGNGTQGYTGDGGAATAANLYSPYGVALDGAGNMYIADHLKHRIRKVNTAGIISTFAGNGTGGFSGDGGAATAAELRYEDGIACDGAGNLYIADNWNQRIRKVTTAGIISTFAGNGTESFSGDCGNATAAELYLPAGVACDAGGNVYIADYGNYRIRKVWANYPNAGPNEINQQDACGNWPGVQIGTPPLTGLGSANVTYVWSPCHLNPGKLSSCAIAQPISSWTNTTTPFVYTLAVTLAGCTATTSTCQVTALANTCSGCCIMIGGRMAQQLSTIPLPENFSVYPNPSNSSITIALYDLADYIRITDMQGRTVYEAQNTNPGELKLDISNYTKGIYFVLAKIGDRLEKQKLIVE